MCVRKDAEAPKGAEMQQKGARVANRKRKYTERDNTVITAPPAKPSLAELKPVRAYQWADNLIELVLDLRK